MKKLLAAILALTVLSCAEEEKIEYQSYTFTVSPGDWTAVGTPGTPDFRFIHSHEISRIGAFIDFKPNTVYHNLDGLSPLPTLLRGQNHAATLSYRWIGLLLLEVTPSNFRQFNFDEDIKIEIRYLQDASINN